MIVTAVFFELVPGSYDAIGDVYLAQIRSWVWMATVAGCSFGPFAMGLSIIIRAGMGFRAQHWK